MKRLLLPLLSLFLLTACADGQQAGEWFPEEKEDADASFWCTFLGNCPPPKTDSCALYGNCKPKSARCGLWEDCDKEDDSAACAMYGNCKAPKTSACSFYGNCGEDKKELPTDIWGRKTADNTGSGSSSSGFYGSGWSGGDSGSSGGSVWGPSWGSGSSGSD